MKKLSVIVGAVVFLAACSSSNKITKSGPQTAADGTINLFDGNTLIGWHPYQNKNPHNWEAQGNGILHCVSDSQNHDHHVDLVTNDTFQNFDLSWDWKIAPRGNSGLIYLAQETKPAAYETGPEYQLIDDVGFPEKLEDWQKTGANYAMNTAPTAKPKPAGEWNSSRIVVNNGHVEHWLNGDKIVEYDLGSDDWKARKAAGKWKDEADYGAAKSGHIALQDHGSEAWFRNITIKRL